LKRRSAQASSSVTLSPASSGVMRNASSGPQLPSIVSCARRHREGVVLRDRVVVDVEAAVGLREAAELQLDIARWRRLHRQALGGAQAHHRRAGDAGFGFLGLQVQLAFDHAQALVEVGQAVGVGGVCRGRGTEPLLDRLEATGELFHGERRLGLGVDGRDDRRGQQRAHQRMAGKRGDGRSTRSGAGHGGNPGKGGRASGVSRRHGATVAGRPASHKGGCVMRSCRSGMSGERVLRRRE